jgi:hypothetical protein
MVVSAVGGGGVCVDELPDCRLYASVCTTAGSVRALCRRMCGYCNTPLPAVFISTPPVCLITRVLGASGDSLAASAQSPAHPPVAAQ